MIDPTKHNQETKKCIIIVFQAYVGTKSTHLVDKDNKSEVLSIMIHKIF